MSTVNPIPPGPLAAYHFRSLGMQYYVSARQGAQAGLLPVTGNLAHHAVETILKGHFANTMGLRDIFNTYRHCLPRLWADFTPQFPGEDLTPFDHFIDELHRFEEIRYPDNILQNGAQITIALGPVSFSNTPSLTYGLSISALDAFMVTMVRVCGINAAAYVAGFPEQVRILEAQNEHFHEWYPAHTW
jgi:hypothetical protein